MNFDVDNFYSRMNTDQLIAYLESEEFIMEANVYIGPPEDHFLSDEDSGDEEDTHVNHLTGNQLRAPVEAKVKKLVDGELVDEEVITIYIGYVYLFM